MEGAYLYFDDNRWIRSGKVVGRSFRARHKEHEAASKKGSSRFYRLYPAFESTTQCAARGHFEDLTMFMGCGLDTSEPGDEQYRKDIDTMDAIYRWASDGLPLALIV